MDGEYLLLSLGFSQFLGFMHSHLCLDGKFVKPHSFVIWVLLVVIFFTIYFIVMVKIYKTYTCSISLRNSSTLEKEEKFPFLSSRLIFFMYSGLTLCRSLLISSSSLSITIILDFMNSRSF